MPTTFAVPRLAVQLLLFVTMCPAFAWGQQASWADSIFGGEQQTDAWGAPQDSSWSSNAPAAYGGPCVSLWDELTFFAGLDGSKQPQDFGVNANLGAQFHVNWGIPVWQEYGLGMQIGTGLVTTGNAVQVYELLGEATGRTQSFTTVGMFQRTEGGLAWGLVYDFLQETSFDRFSLGQWRTRISYDWGECNQFGITANIASQDSSGNFGALATPVTLEAISQGTIYWRHYWETGTQTAFWIGIADGHGENNAVTGPAPATGNVPVIGADILAPLTDRLAIYGEANLIMPADTGTVDAFLGVQWFPWGGAKSARRGQFAPLLPMSSPTSFSVDLRQ